MAYTEYDHDHGVWVRSSADVPPAEDLWPVDEDALEDLARRRRQGRPVRVAGWACILAATGYVAWLGMAAAPRDAMVAWGTMGFLAPAEKTAAAATNASTSPLGDQAPATVADAGAPAAATDAGVLAAATDAGAPAAAADAGALAAAADAGPSNARPLARRVHVAPARPRPRPVAEHAALTAAPEPAAPTHRDADDPYEDVASPQQPSTGAPAAYEPAEP